MSSMGKTYLPRFFPKSIAASLKRLFKPSARLSGFALNYCFLYTTCGLCFSIVNSIIYIIKFKIYTYLVLIQ